LQNFTSFFAEAVSPFPEFDPYCQVVGPAQDDYLPSSPPMSSLTVLVEACRGHFVATPRYM
jgi:hypothetical protein